MSTAPSASGTAGPARRCCGAPSSTSSASRRSSPRNTPCWTVLGGCNSPATSPRRWKWSAGSGWPWSPITSASGPTMRRYGGHGTPGPETRTPKTRQRAMTDLATRERAMSAQRMTIRETTVRETTVRETTVGRTAMAKTAVRGTARGRAGDGGNHRSDDSRRASDQDLPHCANGPTATLDLRGCGMPQITLTHAQRAEGATDPRTRFAAMSPSGNPFADADDEYHHFFDTLPEGWHASRLGHIQTRAESQRMAWHLTNGQTDLVAVAQETGLELLPIPSAVSVASVAVL